MQRERSGKWKGRSAAEVCTSAARKTAGHPLRRARAAPLGRPGFLMRVRSTQDLWGGRCGKELPAEEGGGSRTRLKTGRASSLLIKKLCV